MRWQYWNTKPIVWPRSGAPPPNGAPFAPARTTGCCGELKEIHETIGTIAYFLVGAHALAALFHHFITRDDTLTRMLPERQ